MIGSYRYVHYKPPRLVKTAKKWYVEYWYRTPEELRDEHPREWQRFRVYEDINRYKTEEYAKALLKATEEALQMGFDPFEEKRQKKKGILSLNAALDNYLEYCKDRKLRINSIRAYQMVINLMKNYFTKGNKLYDALPSFTKEDLKKFIKDNKKDWANTTTNNYITLTKAIFSWFAKEEYILKSPAVGLEFLPEEVSKHKIIAGDISEKLKADIKKVDPDLYDFLQVIYYCAMRPKEIRFLQVQHVLVDRKLLFVPASISKNRTDDYIPLGDEVLIMLDKRIDKPKEFYLFGGVKPRSTNFYATRFRPFKEKYKLSENSTMYSFKHSRAIDLAKAGADPYQIMKLFRHSSLEITMHYLRDLGLTDFKDIHDKTKKF